jgi:CubicO group peptidase (beta-lactamase class C family)
MMNEQPILTRRGALASLGAGIGVAVATPAAAPLALADQPSTRSTDHLMNKIPVRGKAAQGLDELDDLILSVIDRHGIPGAGAALARDGKLLLAKGYGWSDVTTGAPTQPDTLFGLASLSKPFTAVAVLRLVEQGKLSLDDRVFDLLKDIKPLPGAKEDPRLRTITVRQCLNHTGGWDRNVTGDPIMWSPQVCRTLRVAPPVKPAQLVSCVMTMPLNFDPGTRAEYSNFGYIVLGEVIAAVSGQPYGRFVRDSVLEPAGAKGARLDKPDGKYPPNAACRHIAGTLDALPPLELPMIDASGGWYASPLDMIRFLTALDGSRGKPLLNEKTQRLMIEPPPKPVQPFPDGTHIGLGLDRVEIKDKTFGYTKGGSNPGERTFMKRRLDSINWVLLFNASMEFDPQDVDHLAGPLKEILQKIDRFDNYTDVDLFKDFT